MDRGELTAIFTIRSWDGKEWKMAVEIPREAGSFGERYVDDTTFEASLYAMVGAGAVAQNMTANLVKEKRLRRDMLRTICVNLGNSLADHLENKEEWDIFADEIAEMQKAPAVGTARAPY